MLTAQDFRTGRSFFGKTTAQKITAIFKDGKSVEYTTAILDDLKDDKSVECIYDSESGEVLFSR